MALECTLIREMEPAVPFTVADGATIEKGSLLILTDPATVAVTTGDTDESSRRQGSPGVWVRAGDRGEDG